METTDESLLVGTSWRRKRRKRRQTRAEKILSDPRGGGRERGTGSDSGENEVLASGDDSSDEDKVLTSGDDSGDEDKVLASGDDSRSEDKVLSAESVEVTEKEACGREVMTGVSIREEERGTPLEETLTGAAQVARQPAVYVSLQRDPEIQVSEYTHTHTHSRHTH